MPRTEEHTVGDGVALGVKALVAVGLAALAGAAATSSGQAYAGDIGRWTAQDAVDPVPTGAVLFIGSSSIRRWEQLALDFADYEIIQRGFGGAQFEDVNFYVNDIVLPYQPRAIVVWAGTNDLSAGESAAEVFGDYQTFVNAVHAQQPAVEIFYLGVTPTTANGPTTAARDGANALIEAAAAADPKLHYVDLPSAFYALNPPNAPEFTALYVDAIHLNRAGYDLWTSIVRPAVEAVVGPNKVFAPNPNTPDVGESIFFDFGPSNPDDGTPTVGPDANGTVWNNWYAAEGEVAINAGEHIGNLVDSTGAATGVGLVITGGFSSNGLQNGGLVSPAAANLGVFATGTATQDYFFSGADDRPGGGNDDIPGGFMLDGLDPEKVYELRFFGSRNAAGSTRVTEYRVTGANEGVATLQTTGTDIGADGLYDGNDDEIAAVAGMRPDAFGQLFADMTVVTGGFAYINAFELRVASLGVSAQPEDRVVSPGGTVALSAEVAGGGAGVVYGWERDGAPVANELGRVTGAATPVLVIERAELADVGRYRLVASLGGDTVMTDEAVVGVRGSADAFDLDNNGVVTTEDVITLLEAL